MSIIDATDLANYIGGLGDGNDDIRLAIAADAASRAVVDYCERAFEKATTPSARVFWPTELYRAEVDDFHTTTGLVVAVDAGGDGTYETVLAASDYYAEPLNGMRDGEVWPYNTLISTGSVTFPSGVFYRPPLQVTAAWGWAELPAPVVNAALLKGHRLYERHGSPEGVLGGFSDLGAVRISTRDDPDATMLLAPYRHGKTMRIA